MICDLDNTLVPHFNKFPNKYVFDFINKIKREGLLIIIASNNTKKRVTTFVNQLQKKISVDGFLYNCKKPFTRKIRKEIGKFNITYNDVVVIGDQFITDIFLAFPGIIFAIALVGILGGSIFNAILALSLISWPKFALLARSQTLVLKNSLFIKASIINGSSDFKIIYKHILPNILPILLTTATLNIGTMIMEIAGLSFLGLGAMPPSAEWGAMMSSGRIFLQIAPWMILAPAAAIFLTVLLFNLFADVLNEKLDPKQLS